MDRAVDSSSLKKSRSWFNSISIFENKYEWSLRLTLMLLVGRAIPKPGMYDDNIHFILGFILLIIGVKLVVFSLFPSQYIPKVIPSLTSQTFWVILCTYTWYIYIENWLDSSVSLIISYWILICTCSVFLHPSERERFIVWHGRLLIGILFLFATIWKIIGGEYLDGSRLHALFIMGDDRTEPIAKFIGGLTNGEIYGNSYNFSDLKNNFFEEYYYRSLTSSNPLKLFALVTSYWVIFIEGAIAAAFLWIKCRWLSFYFRSKYS